MSLQCACYATKLRVGHRELGGYTYCQDTSMTSYLFSGAMSNSCITESPSYAVLVYLSNSCCFHYDRGLTVCAQCWLHTPSQQWYQTWATALAYLALARGAVHQSAGRHSLRPRITKPDVSHLGETAGGVCRRPCTHASPT